ncbi:hypothetical protein FOL47_006340, partial [Perkinsus chesapeaki]
EGTLPLGSWNGHFWMHLPQRCLSLLQCKKKRPESADTVSLDASFILDISRGEIMDTFDSNDVRALDWWDPLECVCAVACGVKTDCPRTTRGNPYCHRGSCLVGCAGSRECPMGMSCY